MKKNAMQTLLSRFQYPDTVVDTPIVDTPIVDTTVVDTPVVDTPVGNNAHLPWSVLKRLF